MTLNSLENIFQKIFYEKGQKLIYIYIYIYLQNVILTNVIRHLLFGQFFFFFLLLHCFCGYGYHKVNNIGIQYLECEKLINIYF